MRKILPLRSLSLVLVVMALSSVLFEQKSFAQIGVAVSIGPPALPVYEQPICPGDGYLWTPGYWAYDYDDADYYWVPGTWVLAPEVGFLWTPGWWGWGDGGFFFHEGFWGPHVGFYGGIYYGFGYFGVGFEGGRWDGGHFFYNRAVMNVNVTEIHNVYNTTIVNRTVTRVSYNGGNGGIQARPTPEEESAGHERHIPPVAAQTQHVQAARSNPQLRASANHGKPPIAATGRPGDFSGRGVVAAKEAGEPYRAENRGAGETRSGSTAGRPGNNAVHPGDLPPIERSAAPNSGNSKADRKYQQQQDKLNAKQNQERQKLQQKQDQEHQKMGQQSNGAQKQQMEQRHQQQTQQLQQRHEQQRQALQARQAPAGPRR
jgi:hypothetical protein